MGHMKQEPGTMPGGEYTAWTTPNGMRAEVRKGSKVVKRLSGETAWADSVRIADDLNVEAKIEARG